MEERQKEVEEKRKKKNIKFSEQLHLAPVCLCFIALFYKYSSKDTSHCEYGFCPVGRGGQHMSENTPVSLIPSIACCNEIMFY